MNQVAQHLPNQARSAVEIVVYISKNLGDEQRDLVVSALENTNGVIGAEFCQTHNHLLLAQYDKNMMSSQDVLKSVSSLDQGAKLIGPI
ncbi:MAG: hypothetical protein PVJ66_02450 [Gammaproteobacteria bacterium]|jgi:cell division protein FtsX